jgi:hypothetical protein
MLVSVVNAEQNSYSVRMGNFTSLRIVLRSALEVSNTIGTLDMTAQKRTHYNTNHSTLKSIASQLGIATGGSSGSSGCYIATMAYGSYEHPQVMILRQFRDDVLYKFILGRWFIKFYYHYSPKLVKLLKNKQFVNKSIRSMLNQFIKVIK